MEKAKLSHIERIVLENIDEQYQWIARDEDDSLYIYKNEPQKVESLLVMLPRTTDYEALNMFNHLFQMVQWNDSAPTLIADLLKE